MRISDWSSDVCSSDLVQEGRAEAVAVVDDEGRAREVHVGMRQCHHAVGRRLHRHSDRAGDVYAVVPLARLAVPDALRAADASDRPLAWPGETGTDERLPPGRSAHRYRRPAV